MSLNDISNMAGQISKMAESMKTKTPGEWPAQITGIATQVNNGGVCNVFRWEGKPDKIKETSFIVSHQPQDLKVRGEDINSIRKVTEINGELPLVLCSQRWDLLITGSVHWASHSAAAMPGQRCPSGGEMMFWDGPSWNLPAVPGAISTHDLDSHQSLPYFAKTAEEVAWWESTIEYGWELANAYHFPWRVKCPYSPEFMKEKPIVHYKGAVMDITSPVWQDRIVAYHQELTDDPATGLGGTFFGWPKLQYYPFTSWNNTKPGHGTDPTGKAFGGYTDGLAYVWLAASRNRGLPLPAGWSGEWDGVSQPNTQIFDFPVDRKGNPINKSQWFDGMSAILEKNAKINRAKGKPTVLDLGHAKSNSLPPHSASYSIVDQIQKDDGLTMDQAKKKFFDRLIELASLCDAVLVRNDVYTDDTVLNATLAKYYPSQKVIDEIRSAAGTQVDLYRE